MKPLSSPSRTVLLRGVAAVCAVLLGASLFGASLFDGTIGSPAHAQTVDSDPVVIEARQRLAAEEGRAAELRVRLDHAAETYERAHAHRIRLQDEAAGQDTAVGAARAQVVDAEESFARTVAASFKQPGGDAVLTEAIVASPSAATALHRVALLERITVRERLRSQHAEVVATRTEDDSFTYQVVLAGIEGAVAEAERAATDLALAVSQARQEVEAASSKVSTAETEAEERIAEEARRIAEEARKVAEEARRASFTAMGSGPMPAVGGKVCPIGAPNGFIDSWGFPRSGGRTHKGVDMFADYGMPLYAVADGQITKVWNNRLGGLSIDLIDLEGHRYYYAHLSEAIVSPGQRVAAGEVIGANGNSGNARTTPPHLHWQFHPHNGQAVNPYPLAAALCK